MKNISEEQFSQADIAEILRGVHLAIRNRLEFQEIMLKAFENGKAYRFHDGEKRDTNKYEYYPLYGVKIKKS